MRYLLVCLSLATVFSAQAKELKNAKNLYKSLVKTFPAALEHTGGFSTAIELKDLSCAKSLTAGGHFDYECNGANINGAYLRNVPNAVSLYSTLLKSGAGRDTTSEPGTTYAVFKKILCERLECKPTRPTDCRNAKVKYSCVGDL